MFNDLQKKLIKKTVRTAINGEFSTTHNSELELVIAQIQKTHPEKFHTSETLRKRVFADEPQSRDRVPYAGFLFAKA